MQAVDSPRFSRFPSVLRGNPNSVQRAIEHVGATNSTVRPVECDDKPFVRVLLRKIVARQTCDCRSAQRGSTDDPSEWAPPSIAAFSGNETPAPFIASSVQQGGR
jgi:hypothetical protein